MRSRKRQLRRRKFWILAAIAIVAVATVGMLLNCQEKRAPVRAALMEHFDPVARPPNPDQPVVKATLELIEDYGQWVSAHPKDSQAEQAYLEFHNRYAALCRENGVQIPEIDQPISSREYLRLIKPATEFLLKHGWYAWLDGVHDSGDGRLMGYVEMGPIIGRNHSSVVNFKGEKIEFGEYLVDIVATTSQQDITGTRIKAFTEKGRIFFFEGSFERSVSEVAMFTEVSEAEISPRFLTPRVHNILWRSTSRIKLVNNVASALFYDNLFHERQHIADYSICNRNIVEKKFAGYETRIHAFAESRAMLRACVDSQHPVVVFAEIADTVEKFRDVQSFPDDGYANFQGSALAGRLLLANSGFRWDTIENMDQQIRQSAQNALALTDTYYARIETADATELEQIFAELQLHE